ncbi:iron-siderophore ABC transporter substrate-binding protein [Paenibacillus glycanilyticus]|uniref:ABC transporter substrate-binding protein n=1 Tax=Paenibacillus glycanilyticus TaxID=126569 RepID=UPI00203EE0FE|nr:iron-siderophore ABC transporter substrate-binding protein [Paenibacillus glycanilyticus]MCM3626812.1 iron-siderophore ABC transporter substrate-binding protein [Paenibacillus glycanilyticus]
MKRSYKLGQIATWFICLALLLTACTAGGNNANEPSGTPPPSPSTEVQESSEPTAYPVTIKHLKGEYALEKKPEVIAVMDAKFADQLVALNEKPAGSVKAAGSDTDFPEYLRDRLTDVKLLGTRDEPNLEAVLALQPDLILMTDFQEEAYENISKIAPTLMLDFDEDWRVTLDTMGKIMGKQAEAKAVEQAYEEKASKLKEQIAAKLGKETVALIRPRTEGIRVHAPDHRTGAILYKDLGLNVPAFVAKAEDSSYEISLEAVSEIGADYYFLLSDAMFADSVKELETTNIWKSLEPVKNDRVYKVDTTTWIAYYGPIANSMIIDQAAEALLGQL